MIRLQRFLSRFYSPLKAIDFLKEYGISSDFIHYLDSDDNNDSDDGTEGISVTEVKSYRHLWLCYVTTYSE